MPTHWRVDYPLTEPALVSRHEAGYPSLGVTFRHDTSGALVGVYHDVTLPDGSNARQAVTASEVALKPLWDLLDFLRMSPLPLRAPTVEQQGGGGPSLTIRGSGTFRARAIVARPIAIPSEASITTRSPRLGAWLRFAIGAREAESHVDAIRDYYMLWEDMKGSPRDGTPEAWLRYARNFVSHGPAMGDPPVLAFLATEFGHAVVQFDPTNAAHLAMAKQWRGRAALLVDGELRSLL